MCLHTFRRAAEDAGCAQGHLSSPLSLKLAEPGTAGKAATHTQMRARKRTQTRAQAHTGGHKCSRAHTHKYTGRPALRLRCLVTDRHQGRNLIFRTRWQIGERPGLQQCGRMQQTRPTTGNQTIACSAPDGRRRDAIISERLP